MVSPTRCSPTPSHEERLLGRVTRYETAHHIAEVALEGTLSEDACVHIVRRLSDWHQLAVDLRVDGSPVREAHRGDKVRFVVLEPVIRGVLVYGLVAPPDEPPPVGPPPVDPPPVDTPPVDPPPDDPPPDDPPPDSPDLPHGNWPTRRPPPKRDGFGQ